MPPLGRGVIPLGALVRMAVCVAVRMSVRVTVCMTVRRRRLRLGFESEDLLLAARRLPVEPLGRFELLGFRHVREALEAEMLQEQGRGAVDDGPAHDVPPPEDADEAALEQGMQHAAAIHASYLLDLRFGNGLLVGKDGQRFERRLG